MVIFKILLSTLMFSYIMRVVIIRAKETRPFLRIEGKVGTCEACYNKEEQLFFVKRDHLSVSCLSCVRPKISISKNR